MKAQVYNQEGGEIKELTLPENVFDVTWNADLVHDVLVSMDANARTPVAHAKDRSDVRGGGTKPWRQKGTGRARHGSIRSPLWVGGGVTFGPRNERTFKKKINQKVRRKALFVALSEKLRQGEVVFVDELELKEAKTKHAKEFFDGIGGIKGLEDIATRRKNRALVVVSEKSGTLDRSFRNFGNVRVKEVENINIKDIVSYKYVIIVRPDAVVETLTLRAGGEKKEGAKKKVTKASKSAKKTA